MNFGIANIKERFVSGISRRVVVTGKVKYKFLGVKRQTRLIGWWISVDCEIWYATNQGKHKLQTCTS